jgi:hypothetical protein
VKKRSFLGVGRRAAAGQRRTIGGMGRRPAGWLVGMLGVAVTCALAVPGQARVERIPNFGYTYSFESGTYSVSDLARGKGYSGRGTLVGRRWPNPPGELIAGNLVKNTRFQPNSVQGTLTLMFRMTRVANETKQTPNGAYRCRISRTHDNQFGFVIRLSVYQSNERVLGRFRLYPPLGEDRRCSPEISYSRLAAYQWFPLAEFTKPRFTLRLRGQGTVDDAAGNRHEIRWNIVVTLARLRSLLPNG